MFRGQRVPVASKDVADGMLQHGMQAGMDPKCLRSLSAAQCRRSVIGPALTGESATGVEPPGVVLKPDLTKE